MSGSATPVATETRLGLTRGGQGWCSARTEARRSDGNQVKAARQEGPPGPLLAPGMKVTPGPRSRPTDALTELLQGVHGVLHVDPEAQPPQRDLVVGHSEGQLRGGAVYDLAGRVAVRTRPCKDRSPPTCPRTQHTRHSAPRSMPWRLTLHSRVPRSDVCSLTCGSSLPSTLPPPAPPREVLKASLSHEPSPSQPPKPHVSGKPCLRAPLSLPCQHEWHQDSPGTRSCR